MILNIYNGTKLLFIVHNYPAPTRKTEEPKKFDLTTKKGLLNASQFMSMEIIVGELVKDLLKSIFDSDSVKKQGEVLIKLIEKGKKRGVKEMDIKVKNRKGFSFKMPMEDGVKIDTLLGSDETMTIHVTYK